MADKFECWSCGACCRLAGFKAPELDRGDKACIHLDDDNRCRIYHERPEFCRLNPKRPVEEQTAWCKLQEANWPEYVAQLEKLANKPSGG